MLAQSCLLYVAFVNLALIKTYLLTDLLTYYAHTTLHIVSMQLYSVIRGLMKLPLQELSIFEINLHLIVWQLSSDSKTSCKPQTLNIANDFLSRPLFLLLPMSFCLLLSVICWIQPLRCIYEISHCCYYY
jgi:hypothetical protein